MPINLLEELRRDPERYRLFRARSIDERRRRLNGPGTLGGVPDFHLEMDDHGSGRVSIALTRGLGSGTFTRATTAYTRLSSGLWTSVSSGVPRSYYLSDGTYAGYVGELARTNLALHSNDFTNAAWVKSNMTAAKTATGPDGVANSASTLTATAANGTALQAITSGSASRIASVFIKRRTGTGTVNITQDNGSTWTAVTVTSGWTQVPSTNQTLTNPTVGIRIVTSGDAVDVWCFMNELSAYAGTPIPTTTATVTRNADVLTYDFAGNASDAAGACYGEFSTLYSAAPTGTAVAVAFSTAGTGSPLFIGGAPDRISINDGTTSVTKTGLTNMGTGIRKRFTSWGGTGISAIGDGAAAATDVFDGAMASTAIGILTGTGGANSWGGTGKNIRLWQRQLSDSVGMSLTA